MVTRILVLLDQPENRRLLAERLSGRYEVVPADSDQALALPYDLAIFDGPALTRLWEQVRARKEIEQPVFLPVLLVTARRDVKMVTRHLWRLVDEIILTPIETRELQARVEALLRARRYSLESEHRYYALAESNPAGVFLLRDEHIIYANPAFAEIGHWSVEQIIGQPFLALVHEEDRAKLLQVPLNRTQDVRQMRLVGEDGVHWVALRAASIFYRGRPATLGTVLDITKQKQAEAEVRRYAHRLRLLREVDRAILEARSSKEVARNAMTGLQELIPYLAAGVVLLDEAHRELRLLAWHTAEANGPAPDQVTPTFPLSDLEEVLPSLRAGKPWLIEDLATAEVTSRVAGLRRMHHIVGGRGFVGVPLLADGQLIGILGVGYSKPAAFTSTHIEILQEMAAQIAIAIQQARLREQVERHASELEQRVEERTTALEQANARLSEVNEELEEFAYIVSHDLKAPLRAITQLAYWLSSDYADVLDEAGQQKLRLLVGRAKRMHNLIEGILQYSRVGRAQERQRPVDLDKLVREIIENLGPPPHITVTIEGTLPIVMGDPTHLEQVFQNLVSNAIKFMDKPEGRITVRGEDRGEFWQFSVSDNGPGIEEKHFERIFKIFQTLAPRNGGPDGTGSTGIGLSLVKKIVERRGGRVWLESTLGKGSTFYFTWPKAEEKDDDEGTTTDLAT